MKKRKAVVRFVLCIRNDGCDDLGDVPSAVEIQRRLE